jgi:hypothetical protein
MALNWEGTAAVIKAQLDHVEKNLIRMEKEYEEKIDRLERLHETKIKGLEEEVRKLEAQNANLVSMANRWKGGGAVLIALGSAVGAVLSYFDHIKSIILKLLS